MRFICKSANKRTEAGTVVREVVLGMHPDEAAGGDVTNGAITLTGRSRLLTESFEEGKIYDVTITPVAADVTTSPTPADEDADEDASTTDDGTNAPTPADDLVPGPKP